jgi:UDP-N-acetylmuramoylalanine--D-glutamate ligase
MQVADFRDKKITVMGLGLNGGGVGIARFLSLAGAHVIMTDMKSEEELKMSLDELKNFSNIKFVLGEHRLEDFAQVDMVVKNPGVKWTNEYIVAALEKNIPVEIDSSLFFKLCRNPIIGVTGTRGKTTTSSLIYEILKTAGKKPVKVGIGQVSVLDKLNELEDDSMVIFELSSWRLSALGRHKLSPQIAVITNMYPDHLNYYSSMEEYVADKKNIFLNQTTDDVCVINADNEITKNFAGEIKSQVLNFSNEEKVSGAYIEDGKIYFAGEEILTMADIKIRGEHNVSNILAAVCVAKYLQIENADIKKAIIEFKGVEHRMEFVREISGVKYFNDTTATSPEGAIAALNSFSENIVLIAGGADKNLDMAELASEILKKTKAVVFLQGAATDKIIFAMKKSGDAREFIIANSMAEAIDEAQKLASAGDVILLSPGSASFGLFKNEFDRGDKFKNVVLGL